MPSSIAHAAVAVIANPLLARNDRSPALVWLAAGAAAAPDLDAVSWILHGGHGGLPDAHRGITHSLAAAVATSAILVALWHGGHIRATRRASRSQPLQSPGRAFAYLAIVIASHGVLDSLASYGEPVAFFAPFSDLRYKPFGVFFRGLTSEVLCLWLPALIFILFGLGGFRRPRRAAPVMNSSQAAGSALANQLAANE